MWQYSFKNRISLSSLWLCWELASKYDHPSFMDRFFKKTTALPCPSKQTCQTLNHQNLPICLDTIRREGCRSDLNHFWSEVNEGEAKRKASFLGNRFTGNRSTCSNKKLFRSLKLLSNKAFYIVTKNERNHHELPSTTCEVPAQSSWPESVRTWSFRKFELGQTTSLHICTCLFSAKSSNWL